MYNDTATLLHCYIHCANSLYSVTESLSLLSLDMCIVRAVNGT